MRKPDAFENYRSCDDLYPTNRFRIAIDVLKRDLGPRGVREYLLILQLAAPEGDLGVDTALRQILDRASRSRATPW